MTNSHESQSEKVSTGGGRAHTTNGTRARGRREPGQKPQPHTGPVRGIALAVRRHRAQPNTSQKKKKKAIVRLGFVFYGILSRMISL
jgi:hypothetical protein